MARQLFTSGLLWSSAIGCGLLAGVYFAFSAFVMSSLARLDQASGIMAMNAINVTIVRSLFMPVFLATSLASAVLATWSLFHRNEAGALLILGGAILYLIGMAGVTMICSVPLNDALAGVAPSSREAAALWSNYLRDWTLWNHVRTVASTGACAFFIAAIAIR